MSGTSTKVGKDWIAQKILSLDIDSILDVGAGQGTYSDLIKSYEINSKIDAVEIWEPYINKFDLKSKYNNVFNSDIRSHDNFNYDLIIFGDVLEHMTRDEAIDVWEKASSQARYAIISIPVVYFPQYEVDGNPFEIHVEKHWHLQRVLKSFKDIVEYKKYDEIGIFFAKFRRDK